MMVCNDSYDTLGGKVPADIGVDLVRPELVAGRKATAMDVDEDGLVESGGMWDEDIKEIASGRTVALIAVNGDIGRRRRQQRFKELAPFLFVRY